MVNELSLRSMRPHAPGAKRWKEVAAPLKWEPSGDVALSFGATATPRIARATPAFEFCMPSFRTTRRVRHSAEHMFDLVADVESYPQFLPLCQSLVIRQRKLDETGDGVILADMRVGYKAIREHFTSRVTLDRPGMTILVEYVEGPFRSLENHWTFKPEPNRPDETGCLVEFFITYEFKSRMLSLLMGSMFDSAFRRFAEAFERRADQVYGRDGTRNGRAVRRVGGVEEPL